MRDEGTLSVERYRAARAFLEDASTTRLRLPILALGCFIKLYSLRAASCGAHPNDASSSVDPRSSPLAVTELTLLTRSYCHLCDEMEAALAPIAARFGAKVAVIDVDAHPVLEERYGNLVPVLLLGTVGDGIELCHYRLDDESVTTALSTAGGVG